VIVITNRCDFSHGFDQSFAAESSWIAWGVEVTNEHKYRVVAWWSSGRTGLAKSDSAPNAIHFSAPPQFGGLEGRWTSEDLLMTALASCFTTTVHTIAEYSKFVYADLEVEAEGIVNKTDSGYCFSEIVIRPSLRVDKLESREQAITLLHKVNELCLVSRALATKPKIEIRIEISKHSAV
jgi:organic hydroperoxide reductase OsmC/OhrA